MSRVSAIEFGSALPIDWERGGAAPNSRSSSQSLGSERRARAAKLLQTLGKALAPDEKVGERLRLAARAAGLEYWRAYDVWYSKARLVEDAELDGIEAAHQANEVNGLRHEVQAIYSRLAIIEARLAALGSRSFSGGKSPAAPSAHRGPPRAALGRSRSLADEPG